MSDSNMQLIPKRDPRQVLKQAHAVTRISNAESREFYARLAIAQLESVAIYEAEETKQIIDQFGARMRELGKMQAQMQAIIDNSDVATLSG